MTKTQGAPVAKSLTTDSVMKSDGHQTAANSKPAAQKPTEAAKPPDGEANQVTVKAVKSFSGIEGFKSPQSEPFEVSRQRAAEMFAAGIIEYTDPADRPGK